MTNNRFKNQLIRVSALMVILFGGLISCTEKITSPEETKVTPTVTNTLASANQLKSATIVNGATTVPTIASITLFAGQTINVGNLVINEVDTNGDGINDALAVSYNLSGGWLLKELHLWIGSDLTKLPRNNGGNPVVGSFPYKPLDAAGKSTYTVNVPFSAIGYVTCSAQYFVAAHASVYNGSNSQTAWSAGTVINPKGQWGTYSTIQVADVTAPSITGSILVLEVEGCSGADAPAAIATISKLEEWGLSIADARTPKADLVVTTANDVVTVGCPIVVTRTYIVTDACGNANTVKQTINVIDKTPPVITQLAPVNVQCAGDVPAVDLTKVIATDNCGGPVTIAHVGDVTSGDACNTVITRTYSATDACGNVSKVDQIITVKDITAPVLSGQGGNVSITAPAVPAFTAPTAIDNCDQSPVLSFTDVTVNGSSSYTVTRTWTAKDACGNVSAPVSQAITVNPAPVVPPVVAPVVTPTGPVLSGENTAWAYNASYAKTFTSLSSENKWGWTNGSLSAGHYTFSLIAGAGNNVLSNGTNVGQVTVDYNGSTANVTYTVIPPYTMNSASLYVGNDVMASFHGSYTAAPGHLGYLSGTGSYTTYSFSVNVTGQIYIMAHADVTAP